MNPWEIDFAKAVVALEAAYDTDRRVYAALEDETKSIWALEPMPCWPEAMLKGPMADARFALVKAENEVRAIVQRRSVALRTARQLKAAMVEHATFAATVPLVLEPVDSRLLATVRESELSWPARLG